MWNRHCIHVATKQPCLSNFSVGSLASYIRMQLALNILCMCYPKRYCQSGQNWGLARSPCDPYIEEECLGNSVTYVMQIICTAGLSSQAASPMWSTVQQLPIGE